MDREVKDGLQRSSFISDWYLLKPVWKDDILVGGWVRWRQHAGRGQFIKVKVMPSYYIKLIDMFISYLPDYLADWNW